MTTQSPVNGIGHVILLVRDLERSLAFYRDVIGLDVRAAGPEFAFLAAGGVTLSLRQFTTWVPPDEGKPPGVEIVFSAPDIDVAYETLRARGVVFRVEPRVVTGSLWAADFRDPDGHVLSIFGPAASQGRP